MKQSVILHAHLLISALLVGFSKNQAQYVQIRYLAEKMRHWETTSDLPTGLYRGQSWDVGVNYLATDSASVEACREVGGCPSMSHFFRKISYLNIFSLIFWNFYQKSCNFWPKPKHWGELCGLRFSLCRGL